MTANEFFKDWSEVINFGELDKALKFVQTLQMDKLCPLPENIFQAFIKCPYNKLKIVMLGQSPYCDGKATGLCFANNKETSIDKISPSLKILKESVEKYCTDDLPFSVIDNVFPTLDGWANQGILLLNCALTTNKGNPVGHLNEWRKFIGSLIENISINKPETIFLLFGETAKTFLGYIKNNIYICSPHPAYCARQGTLLPNVFKEVDNIMLKQNKPLIYWI